MKKIEAVIRQQKLEAVKEALLQAGVEGMTVTQVVGRGHQKGATTTYRGITSDQSFTPHVKVETVVADNEAESVIDAIFQSAHTGQTGDGRIMVTGIENVMRIRTGEVDETDAEFVRHRHESPPITFAPVSGHFASFGNRVE